MKGTVYILFKPLLASSWGKFFIYFITICKLIKRSARSVIMLDIGDFNIIFSRYSNQLFDIVFYRFKRIQIFVESATLN